MADYGSRYQKRETPWGVFFFLLPLFLCGGYILSGFFALPDHLTGAGEQLIYVFKHPLAAANGKTPAAVAAGFIAWLFVVLWHQYYYRNFQMDMEKGDARWLPAEEASRELADEEEKYNRILSGNVKVSTRGSLSNNNMLIIGSSGSYKTTSILHQNLLQKYGAHVVLDVKGDTQRKLGKQLEKDGYRIRSLNFKTPEISDRWNPFVYIEKEDDLLRVIKALHDSVRPRNTASAADPFWDDAVDLYLSALFSYVWLDGREKGTPGTMNDVMRLVNAESKKLQRGDEEVTQLQVLMEEKAADYGFEYPPVRDYFKLKEGAPDTVSSVILMLNGMLMICETAEVRRIFGGNDISFRDIGMGEGGDPGKPLILFLVVPDNNNAYNWIISMFYTQMFDILIRCADDEVHGPLPLPVTVWMDEFYAGARPPETDTLLGVVRSRNISMVVFLQSVSQIKTIYKDNKWEVIMDNTAAVVFLGSGPMAESTHKWVSDLLSETTADSRTDNMHAGSHGSSGLNFSKTGVKLMTPDQVKRMPTTECIVFLEAHPPVYDLKAIPFDQPKKHFKAQKWLKKRYQSALALGDYNHPVYTVYDPVHFRYLTVNRKQRLQVIEDEADIKAYRAAAEKNPDIYTFDIDEKDILYLSWGRRERSKEEVEGLLKDALAAQDKKAAELGELSVLQDIDKEDPTAGALAAAKDPGKSDWDTGASLRDLLSGHWDAMPLPEQEEICLAMDDGLTEEQVRKLMYLPLDEMELWHRAFRLQNKGNG